MYVVDPGETVKVESATADPIGLKVGIAYDYDSDVRGHFDIHLLPFISIRAANKYLSNIVL